MEEPRMCKHPELTFTTRAMPRVTLGKFSPEQRHPQPPWQAPTSPPQHRAARPPSPTHLGPPALLQKEPWPFICITALQTPWGLLWVYQPPQKKKFLIHVLLMIYLVTGSIFFSLVLINKFITKLPFKWDLFLTHTDTHTLFHLAYFLLLLHQLAWGRTPGSPPFTVLHSY